MVSKRHKELLQSRRYPEPASEPIIHDTDDIQLELLREVLFTLISKVPRVIPEKTTVEWPVQETGQIMSALMRYLTPELTRVRPTHLPKRVAQEILTAEDFRRSNIGKIGARRYEILREALKITMNRPRS